VLIAGAFLCDFIWIACIGTGLEVAMPGHFWDDWSHSLASTLVWATLYGGGVWLVMRRTPGVRVIALAAFIAVLSHFFLDLPTHDAPIALYPYSDIRFPGLASPGPPPLTFYWRLQFAIVLVLGAVYAWGAYRLGVTPRRIGETCLSLLGVYMFFAPENL